MSKLKSLLQLRTRLVERMKVEGNILDQIAADGKLDSAEYRERDRIYDGIFNQAEDLGDLIMSTDATCDDDYKAKIDIIIERATLNGYVLARDASSLRAMFDQLWGRR